MNVVSSAQDMTRMMDEVHASGRSVGFVPTMGFLHQGHASLIRASAAKHPVTVVSVFVNPTQFGPNEDYERYPRDIEGDLRVISQAGGTHVFVPTVHDIYPDGAKSTIHIDEVTEVLEGASRPTHFDGVATVVSRLFCIVLPTEVFFGQKDLQQTLVIKKMVAHSPLPAVNRAQITVLPTQREPDGLAMSSRNVYLSATERASAPVIYRALQGASHAIAQGVTDVDSLERIMHTMLKVESGLVVEYAVAVDATTLRPYTASTPPKEIALLIAGRIGKTRLIDNAVVTATT